MAMPHVAQARPAPVEGRLACGKKHELGCRRGRLRYSCVSGDAMPSDIVGIDMLDRQTTLYA